jgi:hypothetical protein
VKVLVTEPDAAEAIRALGHVRAAHEVRTTIAVSRVRTVLTGQQAARRLAV